MGELLEQIQRLCEGPARPVLEKAVGQWLDSEYAAVRHAVEQKEKCLPPSPFPLNEHNATFPRACAELAALHENTEPFYLLRPDLRSGSYRHFAWVMLRKDLDGLEPHHIRNLLDYVKAELRKRGVALLDETESTTTGPAVEPRRDGRGMGWREARDEADRLRVKGYRWTSYRQMARTIGCSESVLHKAIAKHGTAELQEWASKPKRGSRRNLSPEAAEVVFDRTPQRREPDPGNAIEQPDVDVALQFLIEQAKRSNPELGAEAEAKIGAMDEASRRVLAEQLYDDPDRAEQVERYRQRGRKQQD